MGLPGEASSDNDTVDKTLPSRYAGKTYRIGSLSGPLIEEMEAAFIFTAYVAGAVDAPVVLSGDGLANLSETERTGLAASYAAFQPVILLDATADQINALRQILGLTGNEFTLPEGVDRAEIYALDSEPDQEVWQWVQYPPREDELNPDNETDQQTRVNYLIDWLDDNQNRKTLAELEGQPALAAAKEAAGNRLTDLASAFVDQRNFSEVGNFYQISHFVYGFHSVTTGEDWFYIQQEGMFNGRGGYQGRSVDWLSPGDIVDGYMESIDINTTVKGYARDAASIGLIQSSPETANNQTEISSGTTYDVGGDVSLDKKGVSSSLSGGVSVNYSTSFSVRDCTALNKCGDEGNNAHWTYAFKRCQASVPVYYLLYAVLPDPPALSISTFQPVNQWIWRMAPKVRDNPPSMHVKLQVNRIKSRGVAKFFWVPDALHTVLEGNVFQYDVTLPLPPKGQ